MSNAGILERMGDLTPLERIAELEAQVEQEAEVLEAAERGLTDAENIIASRHGGDPTFWVGGLILGRVRRALAGDYRADSQTDAKALAERRDRALSEQSESDSA